MNTTGGKMVFEAMEREWPWKAEEQPALAEWLEANGDSLDSVVVAADKPHSWFPSPSLLDEQPGRPFDMDLPDVHRLRDVVCPLTGRARLHLGEGVPAFGYLDSLARWQASVELSRTAAALAAWRADRPTGASAYPERLDELVPRYLVDVPIDPFNDLPLRYERRGDGYLLMSVSSNGIDDGGDGSAGWIIDGEWQTEERLGLDAYPDIVVRVPVPRRSGGRRTSTDAGMGAERATEGPTDGRPEGIHRRQAATMPPAFQRKPIEEGGNPLFSRVTRNLTLSKKSLVRNDEM